MIEAVLFDFDGVIADTLTYHVQAWQKVFKSYNVKVKFEDIAIIEGAKAFEIALRLVEKKKLSFSQDECQQLALKKRQVYRSIIRATAYPEIVEFINKLKLRPLKLGLVTGSILSNVLCVVNEDFIKSFQVIITSDDVKKCKPDPEPFLTASNKLQIPPENCIVIENAPFGIKSAKVAGMKCIALRTTIKDDEILKEADLIVNDVSEIDIDKLF